MPQPPIRGTIDDVEFGMSPSEVEKILGPPRDTQVMDSTYGYTEYWYYGRNQIVFDNRRVTAKNRF